MRSANTDDNMDYDSVPYHEENVNYMSKEKDSSNINLNFNSKDRDSKNDNEI